MEEPKEEPSNKNKNFSPEESRNFSPIETIEKECIPPENIALLSDKTFIQKIRKSPFLSNNKLPTEHELGYYIREPTFRKVKTLHEMIEIRKKIKQEGKTLVWTNGCFDLGHWGHCRYLQCAKAYGDYLLVVVNSDESVRRLKGPLRPISELIARLESLSSLEPVDYIVICDDDAPLNELLLLNPDIYVKGNDYTIDMINQQERKIVESNGGKVIITPTSVESTTNVVEKMTKYLVKFYDPKTGEVKIKGI